MSSEDVFNIRATIINKDMFHLPVNYFNVVVSLSHCVFLVRLTYKSVRHLTKQRETSVKGKKKH